MSEVERPVASATYGFVRFLGGGLAPFAAGKLAERFTSLDQLARATYGDLIPVVGPATARALFAHLAETRNQAALTALAAAMPTTTIAAGSSSP